MKKFYIFAAAAALAATSLNAAVTDPSIDAVINDGTVFDAIILNDGAIETLKKAGKTVNDYRVNDETRFLYVWDETFVGGDGSYPGPGMHTEGYVSLNVGTIGWSGCGWFEGAGSNVDLSHLNENSHFHLAYRTESNGPSSIAFKLGDVAETQARFALGTSFNDNGTIFSPVASAINDEWQVLDITLTDLKKACPTFDIASIAVKDFGGEKGQNLLSMLGGGVTGQNICIDQVYFYTKTDGSAVEVIEAAESDVEYFNLQGVKVVDPTEGIFIRRQGSKVEKVIL